MATIFTYEVVRMDGTGFKSFKNKTKAEAYALTLKRTPDEKVQITRKGKAGYTDYVYYI